MNDCTRRAFALRLSASAFALSTMPLLSACATKAADSARVATRDSTNTRAPTPKISKLQILSAGQGSAFLPYSQTLASSLTARGVNSVAVETAGSIENVRKLDAYTGEPMLGTVFLGTAHEAVTGSGAWTQGKSFANLRALFPMYETSFQCVALRNADIASIAQMKGKRVGVGPAGGPAEHYFKGLNELRALNATLVNGAPAALANDLRAGKIDALWQGAAVPIPAIKQIADAVDAVVFALDASDIAPMLAKFPALAATRVTAHSYRGQSAELNSIAAWNFVMTHRETPNDLVTWLLQTVFDPASPLPMHPSAANTRIEQARTNRVVPFHPAAARFYASRGIRLT
jgi:uncharacterized protein